ncbi:MAG: flagellar filament capping protein FliD [Lachnospiraceae bacterium]|nr:flagellar filament capping protein FliD [Lachnospiraceae bacterium]
MPIRLSGLNSGLDTEAIIKELVSAYDKKTENLKKDKTKLEWKQEKWKDLNKKVYSFYTDLSSMRFSTAYNVKKTTVSDTTKATIAASNNAVLGTQTLNITSTAKTAYLTGGVLNKKLDGEELDVTADTKLSDLGVTADSEISINGKDVALTSSMTVSEAVNALKEAGVTASFDAGNKRIFISSNKSGADEDFNLKANDADGANALKALGLLTEESLNGVEGVDVNEDAVRIKGEDAEIYLNGAKFTSSTNTFSINGLTINVTGTTNSKNATKAELEASALSINTTADTQAVYDKIKDMFKKYNELINELTGNYNADSASKYQPLTDDEKDEMSDEEVEKWEKKIKDSLLRRDSSVNTVMQAMISVTSKSYEVNGEKLALSSFGIKTLGIFNSDKNEQNAFHIDGDKDDTNTAENTDKLMAAIAEDPEKTMSFFQQMFTDLYGSLGDTMKSTSLSSSFTAYNDKEYKTKLNDIEKSISKWEDKVADIEDRYYKMFSNMEKQLAEINNRSSALSNLFGGGA